MILDVSPRRLEAHSGFTQYVQVTISNPGEVIGGYQVRVLGADPSWVKLDDATISLFPQESTTVSIELTLPEGLPAGERQLSVQVRELTPPEDVAVESVVIEVPEAPNVHLRVDPIVQQAGRKVRYAMLLDNAGNTVVEGRFAGTDPEDEARFTFTPPTVRLLPGEHAVIDVLAKARQPLLGSPIIRALNFYLDDPETQAALAEQAKQAGKQLDPALDETPEADKLEFRVPGRKRQAKDLPKPERPTDPLATATFIQKARIGRAAVSLGGLLAAVSVFALVITFSLSQIVKQSAADRDLALAIVSAQNSDGGATGSSSLGGTVRLLTSSTPVPGVAVTLYKADDVKNPLATTATGADGTYTFENLPASDYKVNYKGAGFIQLWYPAAIDPGDAATVTLDANNRKGGLDVTIGGVAVTLAGKVTGTDVAGATITLLTPTNESGSSSSSTDATTVSSVTDGLTLSASTPTVLRATDTLTSEDVANAAIVKTVAIGGDGAFQIDGVPSPSVYILQVSKPGYATSAQRVNVAAGENREGLSIALRQGDGVISGTVSDTDGALGGATITATSGSTVVTTQSLADGTYTLRGLPTPGQVSVVATKEPAGTKSWGSQTMTVTLSAGQSLTGIALLLGAASADLGGTVTVTDGSTAQGVIVTLTDGSNTFTTATTATGAWTVTGVPVPGTYAVSFKRTGLAGYSLILELDKNGALTGNLASGVTGLTGVNATLHSGTGSIIGLIRDGSGSSASSFAGARVVASCIDSTLCGANSYTAYVAAKDATNTAYATGTSLVAPLFNYAMDGIVPGRYSLTLYDLNGNTVTSSGVVVAAATTPRWDYDYAEQTYAITVNIVGSPNTCSASNVKITIKQGSTVVFAPNASPPYNTMPYNMLAANGTPYTVEVTRTSGVALTVNSGGTFNPEDITTGTLDVIVDTSGGAC